MISFRNVAISVFWAALSTPPTYTQYLSRRREFQLGTNLPAVAKKIRVKPSEAKAIHERPAMIQGMEWQAPFTDSSRRAESVGNIIFSDAQIYLSGAGPEPFEKGVLWRGRLETVNGFSLGRLSPG
jgi:hypothetical protein